MQDWQNHNLIKYVTINLENDYKIIIKLRVSFLEQDVLYVDNR